MTAFLPPATLPGVSSTGPISYATKFAATVPQTMIGPGTPFAKVAARLGPVLATDRAGPSGMLGQADLGSSAIGESTVSTSSGGGGSGSAGSLPVGEGETEVPDVVGGNGNGNGNGNDVSEALGTSIGAALRGSLLPLAIGAGVGLLLGFVLSR